MEDDGCHAEEGFLLLKEVVGGSLMIDLTKV
jgi:hypothetical protein